MTPIKHNKKKPNRSFSKNMKIKRKIHPNKLYSKIHFNSHAKKGENMNDLDHEIGCRL